MIHSPACFRDLRFCVEALSCLSEKQARASAHFWRITASYTASLGLGRMFQGHLEAIRKLVAPTSRSAVQWVFISKGHAWRRGRRPYIRSGDRRCLPFSIYGQALTCAREPSSRPQPAGDGTSLPEPGSRRTTPAREPAAPGKRSIRPEGRSRSLPRSPAA